MPFKPQRFCKWPGCCNLTDGSYCSEHIDQYMKQVQRNNSRYNRQRGSAASQGYDGKWRKVRNAYLLKHPVCERCEKEGKTVPATLVHHIIEIKQGGARLDASNLMALCNECHEEIHGQNRFKRRG